MFDGWCHFGNWGSFGNFGVWGWVGLMVGLILLVVWAARRARVSAATSVSAGGQTTAKEILQAGYVRGEINREQHQQMLDDVR